MIFNEYGLQLAIHYLAVFRLTANLWEALEKAAGTSVINVSWLVLHFAPLYFEEPNFEYREYETLLGYGKSKTAFNPFTLQFTLPF